MYNIPKSPGIYYFYDKDMVLLYIGTSNNLHIRLNNMKHHHILNSKIFIYNTKIKEVVEEVFIKHIVYRTFLNTDNMLKIESKAIKLLEPKLNRWWAKHQTGENIYLIESEINDNSTNDYLNNYENSIKIREMMEQMWGD